MLGYIFAAVIGILLLALGFAALRGGRTSNRNSRSPEPKPVQMNKPAADEPTPDNSTVASAPQVTEAKKHIPPA